MRPPTGCALAPRPWAACATSASLAWWVRGGGGGGGMGRGQALHLANRRCAGRAHLWAQHSMRIGECACPGRVLIRSHACPCAYPTTHPPARCATRRCCCAWRASRRRWPPPPPPPPLPLARAARARSCPRARERAPPRRSPATTLERSCGGLWRRSGCYAPSCGPKVRRCALICWWRAHSFARALGLSEG